GDFAAIRSLAIDDLRAANPDATFPSIFVHDYQYNLGVSTRLRLELHRDPLTLRGQGMIGNYESIEGFDREEEQITQTTYGQEALREYKAALALEPGGSLLHVELSAEQRSHRSDLNEFTRRKRDRRLTASVGLLF
ncbi:MAG TPA: hypothetical protein VHO25_13755, partial [Polyangiaceae bacterium]|nr:hypothetical protein [Polyangiaceae bacterium]